MTVVFLLVLRGDKLYTLDSKLCFVNTILLYFSSIGVVTIYLISSLLVEFNDESGYLNYSNITTHFQTTTEQNAAITNPINLNTPPNCSASSVPNLCFSILSTQWTFEQCESYKATTNDTKEMYDAIALVVEINVSHDQTGWFYAL